MRYLWKVERERVPANMDVKSVTFATCHSLMSLSNLAAPLNMFAMLVTELVCQSPMSSLNDAEQGGSTMPVLLAVRCRHGVPVECATAQKGATENPNFMTLSHPDGQSQPSPG